MADTLKNKVRFSTTLFPETKARLDNFTRISDIPVSKITDKAINEFLDRMEPEKKRKSVKR